MTSNYEFPKGLRKIRTDPGAYTTVSADGDSLAVMAQSNWLVAIDPTYMQFFSAGITSDNAYRWFLSLTGTHMKKERDRTITVLSGSDVNGCGTCPSFVLKASRYSNPFRSYTLGQTATAEREYRGFKQCGLLGIPVAEPVCFGVERGRGGTVRSCFFATRLVEESIDFRAWLRQRDEWKHERHEQTSRIIRTVGRHLRKAHEKRFFLMRPAPKNILLCDAETPEPKVMFIDLALARLFPLRLAARWGQRVDFGWLFGPFLRWNFNEILEPFLETYLPDPFGQTPEELRRSILQAARIRKNRTMLAWASHKIHRRLRRLT